MNIKLSLTGVNEIDQVLKGLPNQINHRIMGAAHADAAKPIIPAAQSRIKNKTGRLRDSLGTEKISVRKSNQIGLVYVGPRRKRGKKGFHGHLVEFGHKLVSSKKSGKRQIGFVRPYPFMEPAFHQTKAEVTENIKTSVAKKLVSFMKRTIKKGGGTFIQ